MNSQEQSTTLYVNGESWFHCLHPFTKLAYVLLAGVTVYLAPGGWWVGGALLVFNLVLAALCGVVGRAWKILWRTLLPLVLFMIPIHVFLYPGNVTPVVTLNSVSLYLEGLRFAGSILLQLTVVLSASLLFILCTHPADFITATTQAGWPPSLAYLLGSPLLMLPAMRARVEVIQSAQRARGLDSEGNIFRRIKSVGPLVVPFVLGALIEIEQRAVALEVRGFNSRSARTSWRCVPDSRIQRLSRRAMFGLAVGIIIYRVVR
ncbi:energy-coupling factor transporter transmembrane component T [uncultured Pseudodesulfovibrio sp.]|uniref:energy-coupling factor transporter transmembrane component T family protein n=1 Tax=uncultured Pseudodesulfovibrio sp. TaxID=2035858 RepID=UPI0029C618F6|nr:energy-coupling factor transporter transmembrane component T [uncultured Pseudodesulfovibrio sp.]